MNNIFFSFLLTIFAGLSTLIGYLIIFLKKRDHNKIIVSSLSFAAGVMVCTSICDLIPESIYLLKNNLSFLSTILFSFGGIILGIIISMIIDYYVPDTYVSDNKALFRVGFLSMIAIIMHNVPEGIATFMASNSNMKLGLSLAIAIAMHNIPEGISIAIPIYYSTGSKKKAFIYTLISALSEPVGALLAYLFLRRIVNDTLLGLLFSLIGGIMLEISFRVLLPNTKKYNDKLRVILFFMIGIVFMLLKFLL